MSSSATLIQPRAIAIRNCLISGSQANLAQRLERLCKTQLYKLIPVLSTFVFAAGCANDVSQKSDALLAPVPAQQVAEYESESFDACTLTTPEDTWAYWDVVFSEEEKGRIKSTAYRDLILFHFGWGMGIRNGLCLWRGGPLKHWFEARGLTHPDDMSGYLIALYWARLNGCIPDVEAFVSETYPSNPELLNCPSSIDVSMPDYLRDAASM